MSATISFAFVVRTANVLTHSPVLGSFQFSQMPASPNGEPSFIPIAKGCFTFSPLIAFHSKNKSTGMMQRRRAYASRNIGSVATVAALALMGGGFGFSLHQYGIRPHFSRSSERSPGPGPATPREPQGSR